MRASKVFIASDHAGVSLKQAIQKLLPDWTWEDLGPLTTDSVDYPDYARKVGAKVTQTSNSLGILICGSGVGMSIAANKIEGIRAALVENPVAAKLSREHNDANVLCLGSRFLAPEYGAEIAKTWLETPFSNGDRHKKRLEKLEKLEKGK